jgi:hypothetical protein
MADTSARPAYVCECGQVNEKAHDRVTALQGQLVMLTEDIANLERDLRSKRSHIKRLQSKQDMMLREDPLHHPAMNVLNHWKATCSPKARELAGTRLERVLARLRAGYTEAELKRACDGYALQPYVVAGKRSHEGPKDAWHADAELIFRDAKHVDQGLRIADRADDLRQMFTATASTAPLPSSDASPVVQLSELGEAAVLAAERGLAVFPCLPREKVPATRNGFKDAKRDVDAIRAFWTRMPDANVGMPTGAGNGLLVVDIDGDDGWDSWHQLQDFHGEVPDTLSVVTPRGGQHFYFRHPGREVSNTAGFPGPGIDIRGDGGYVLIPPSVGPGGRRYEKDESVAPIDTPPWLIKVLLDGQLRRDAAMKSRDWAAFIRDGAKKGQRDTAMTSFVGHLFQQGLAFSEIRALASVMNLNIAPPLAEKDLDRIVKSIGKKNG